MAVTTDSIIITPEKGRHKEIGQALLAMADSPHDVQWVTWPTAGYQVPLELFAKFHVTDGADGEWLRVETNEENLAAIEAAQQPEKKRRGRPRKETSTDNTDSEEE